MMIKSLTICILAIAFFFMTILWLDALDARIRTNFVQIQEIRRTVLKHELPQLQINRATIYPNAGNIVIETTEVAEK